MKKPWIIALLVGAIALPIFVCCGGITVYAIVTPKAVLEQHKAERAERRQAEHEQEQAKTEEMIRAVAERIQDRSKRRQASWQYSDANCLDTLLTLEDETKNDKLLARAKQWLNLNATDPQAKRLTALIQEDETGIAKGKRYQKRRLAIIQGLDPDKEAP